MLAYNPVGGYRFLGEPGRPFSGGVVADDGFDLVHARFEWPMPLDAGLRAAAKSVTAAGRPVQSVAGFELRIPRPLSLEEFDTFNRGYVALLQGIGLEVDGLMPATRTNVAALAGPVTEPGVVAFSYTSAGSRTRPGFVMSGVPEAEPGDPEAMLDSIMNTLTDRMDQLGVTWDDATAIQLYGTDNVQTLIVEKVLGRTGRAAARGIHWFPSLPPITGLRLEIDVRSAGADLVITA